MTGKKRIHDLLAMLVATAVVDLGASQVHAIGYGGGYGIIGGFNYVPSPGDFINQHALLNAGRAGCRYLTTSMPTIPTPMSIGFEITDLFLTQASWIDGRRAIRRAAFDLSRA